MGTQRTSTFEKVALAGTRVRATDAVIFAVPKGEEVAVIGNAS